MKASLLVAGLLVAYASAGIVNIKSEPKTGDASFMKKQQQVLRLWVGVGHDNHFEFEHPEFDLFASKDQFSDPSVVEKLYDAYKGGFLPQDAVYSTFALKARIQTSLLFDVFYFAKDWDTFYKSACWARKHMNPMMFAYTFSLALQHRNDCKGLYSPPPYEVFPTYFVPASDMHTIYDMKMSGQAQGKVTYNSTGWESNYYPESKGSPFNFDVQNPHLENKISYFREDVGLNHYFSKVLRAPFWMDPAKYGSSKYFFKSGEKFYYALQQLFARYTLERLANGLPFAEYFEYDRPIVAGYNSRLTHFNGRPFVNRPDGFNFDNSFHKGLLIEAKTFETRLIDALDAGTIWNTSSNAEQNLLTEDGMDIMGHLFTGSPWDHKLNRFFYRSYYYTLVEALAYASNNKDSTDFNGGVTSMKMTTARDPAFYNVLNRVLAIMQKLKYRIPKYSVKDLTFEGVSVQNFEVDKLITYFDTFEYDVTNGVGFKKFEDYFTYKYSAKQFTLNHKPFNYKITVKSAAAQEGMVRIFIGPKYDSEEHELTLTQKRRAMVEIDRFPVQLAAGDNILERSSEDTPIFAMNPGSFKSFYEYFQRTLKTNEPFKIFNEKNCGMPHRLMLPRGWRSGQLYTFVVVVTPMSKSAHPEGNFCGYTELYDNKAFGFPFDRNNNYAELHVPNIYFSDQPIYHKKVINAV